jgi:Bacterial Ig-like domain/WD40-like Beta Propeller Repeat
VRCVCRAKLRKATPISSEYITQESRSIGAIHLASSDDVGKSRFREENGLVYFTGPNGVYSVDPTSSTPQPTRIIYGHEFDVSRDSKTLVYDYFGRQLFTYPLSENSDPEFDRTEVQITNRGSSATDIRSPSLSPDGQTIYFAGQRVIDSDDPEDDTYGIYSVPVGGGEATKIPITSSEGVSLNLFNFALSHDGLKIATGGTRGVFTVPVSGGVATRITNDCSGAFDLDFSPDDQTIIYDASASTGDDCSSGRSIHTLFTTPVTNDRTSPGTLVFPEDILPPYPTNPNHRAKWHPTYSPDGKYIAFSNWTEIGTNVATASAEGGTITNIGGCVSCYPVWARSTEPTTIDSGPSGRVNSTTASFTFSSNEKDATFECKLDNGPFEECTSPTEYTDLADGSHTFEVRATHSGVTDDTPASSTWTVDTVAPTVDDVFPERAAVKVARTVDPEVTFSEEMDDGTLWGNFTLTKQGSSSPVPWSSMLYERNGINRLTMYPASDLELNTTYTATIKGGSNGAKDVAGNALKEDYTWAFATGTRLAGAPTVVSYTPTQTTGVPRSTQPTATFSTAMDEKTIKDENNIKLQVYNKRKQRWISVARSVDYDPVSRIVTVIPDSPLAASKKYRVTITTNVESSTGIALDQNATTSGNQPKRWIFTTGSA